MAVLDRAIDHLSRRLATRLFGDQPSEGDVYFAMVIVLTAVAFLVGTLFWIVLYSFGLADPLMHATGGA